MLRLNIGFCQMVEKVKEKFTDHLDNFFEDMTKQTSQTFITTNMAQQPQLAHEPQKSKPHLSYRITHKNNMISHHIVNKHPRKSHPVQQTLKQQQQEHLLLSRKKKLLSQLNEINSQLKSRHQQSRIISPMNIKENTEEMTIMAQDLVKRMNQQRKEQSFRRKKSIEQLNESIVRSIGRFHEALREEERMKELRRKEIQQRIDQRKIKAIERGVSVNMSQSVINHFVNRVRENNYGNNNNEHEQQNIQPRMHTDCSQLPQANQRQLNPEQYASQIPYLPHIKTQQSKQSLNSSAKSYQRSPFLQKVMKEQQRQKKLQYLKTLEKKRVNLKQREYAEKMRGRAKQYASNSMFLT